MRRITAKIREIGKIMGASFLMVLVALLTLLQAN